MESITLAISLALGGALERLTHLDVSVQGAGTLGTVRDPVGLLVDGSQTRWWRGGVLSVALHPRQQDAAQGGLGGGMQHQLRGKACRRISTMRHQVKQHWTKLCSFL